MAKKVLCVMLAVAMVFGSLAVTSFAAVDYKDLIDRTFLSGRVKTNMTEVPETADDEAILQENLLYWDEEVQTAYNAAETNEDYEALYNLMSTPAVLDGVSFDDVWYAHRDESYGQVSVRYVADKLNAEAGERITVNVYLTTNFYTPSAAIGIEFDKNLVDIETISQSLVTFSGWNVVSKNTNYGFLANGTDVRSKIWPESMRNKTAYANKGLAQIYLAANTNNAYGNYAKKFNDDLVCSATFIVKDSAPSGAAITFTAPTDGDWKSEDFFAYYENSSSLFGFERVTENAYPYKVVDEMTFCDHVYTVKGCSLSAGDVAYADYTAYNLAVEKYTKLVNKAGTYTVDSWTAFKNAATADLDKNLTVDDQRIVNDATAAIEAAYEGLRVKGITEANVVGAPALNTNANIKFVVAGSPSIIRIVDTEDRSNTITIFREDASVTKEDGYETWYTTLFVEKAMATYTAYAKYSDGYSMNSATLKVVSSDYEDLTIHTMKVCDMFKGDGSTSCTNNGRVTIGKHNIIFTTSTDVYKIQFVNEYGNTWTYCAATKGICTDEGTERTWNVTLNFYQDGPWKLTVRTRSIKTSFISGVGDDLNAYVIT